MVHTFTVEVIGEQVTIPDQPPVVMLRLTTGQDDQRLSHYRILSRQDITSRYWPSGNNLIGEVAGDMIAHMLIELGVDWDDKVRE